MKEISRALVVGAGAVGSAVAAALERGRPGSVSLLASGARAERLEAGGLLVNGRRYDLPLAPSGKAPEPGREPGLIVVAVKGTQLESAIADLAPYVGPDTLILSLLNGISSEEELGRVFGPEKVPLAMIIGIDAVREGGETRYSALGRVTFGEPRNDPARPGERVSRIAAFLDSAGLPYEVPEDLRRAYWRKFMINVGINQASAVLRAPYRVFQTLPSARAVTDAAMREVIALSGVLGTGLEEEDLEAWYRTLAGLAPEAKTSMLQDVEAGRPTEVGLFAGTVVELAERARLPCPVNRLFLDLIRTMEAGYGGPSEAWTPGAGGL